MPELRRLILTDDPTAWVKAGFLIEDPTADSPEAAVAETAIGTIAISFVEPAEAGPGTGTAQRTGIVGWELTDIEDGVIDGITATGTDAAPSSPVVHPNGVSRLDHVVVMTPDLERTTASLRSFGFSPRRTRAIPGSEPPRSQIFFWAGETIFEVVGPVEATGSGPARVWGFALTTNDMNKASAAIGSNLGTPKPAVQPGRHIATIDTGALGITPALALMTPHLSTPDSSGSGAPETQTSESVEGQLDA